LEILLSISSNYLQSQYCNSYLLHRIIDSIPLIVNWKIIRFILVLLAQWATGTI